MEMKGKRFTNF